MSRGEEREEGASLRNEPITSSHSSGTPVLTFTANIYVVNTWLVAVLRLSSNKACSACGNKWNKVKGEIKSERGHNLREGGELLLKG